MHVPSFLNDIKPVNTSFIPRLGAFARNLLWVHALLVGSFFSQAQDINPKAKELVSKAIKLEDEGNMDVALPLLKEAFNIDSNNHLVVYELGYYYYSLKDYPKALEFIKKTTTLKGVNAQAYQMLGNIYDFMNDSAMAMKSYKQGLDRYPDAGRLYLETANIFFNRKIYDSAIKYYEKGIEVEPEYPSEPDQYQGYFCISQWLQHLF